jgi:hypothetical protein
MLLIPAEVLIAPFRHVPRSQSIYSFGVPERRGHESIYSFGVPERRGHESIYSFGVPERRGHESIYSFGVPERRGHKSIYSFGVPERRGHKSIYSFGVPRVERHETNLGLTPRNFEFLSTFIVLAWSHANTFIHLYPPLSSPPAPLLKERGARRAG